MTVSILSDTVCQQCPVKQCNYFKWAGKRCVDSRFYNAKMDKIQRRRQEQEERPYTLEGSGVITAIRNRSTSIQFHLRSMDKIGITVGDNGYSLLDALRQLPAITFDEMTKEWTLPATFQLYTHAYESLLTSPYYRTIYSTPLDDMIVRFLPHDHSTTNTDDDDFDDEATTALDVEERIKINVKSHSIWNHMMDYQQEGVRECLLKGGRVLLADEMGLGKTIQALAVSLAYVDSWPVLVICPASLLFTWLDQIQQWLYPVVSNKDIRITLKGSHLFGFSPFQVLPVGIVPSQDSLVDMNHSTNVQTLNQHVSQPQYQSQGTSLSSSAGWKMVIVALYKRTCSIPFSPAFSRSTPQNLTVANNRQHLLDDLLSTSSATIWRQHIVILYLEGTSNLL